MEWNDIINWSNQDEFPHNGNWTVLGSEGKQLDENKRIIP